jgi:uncharacterized protein (DUF1330 family)
VRIAFAACNRQTLAEFSDFGIGRMPPAATPSPEVAAMSAYIVVDCEVTDPVRYEDYKKLAQTAIAKHGGRYLVRGGETKILEGSWKPHRIVVVEFPSANAIKRFYASPEYQAARAKREGAARMSIVAVEGI